jgi:hypothetical protein
MITSKRIAVALVAAACTLAVGVEDASAQRTIDEILTGGPAARASWEQRVVLNRGGGGAQESLSPEPEFMLDAETIPLGPMVDGGIGPAMDCDCGTSGYGDCGDRGDCGDCGGCGGCGECGFSRHGWLASGWLKNLSLFAGVQGFKGPVDFGVNGNVGFHEGLNFGAPLGGFNGVGYQIGFQATQSNLSGSVFEPDGSRDQAFLTAGLFRRATCGGFQWAAAFDLMHENYYYGTIDLKQIRVEAAFVRPGVREIGFWGSFGSGDDALQGGDYLEPISLYAFFYRRYFCGGGEGRLWSGFSGRGDGLLGGDARLPLSGSWALEGNFNYLLPKQGRGVQGYPEESWGMMVQLVWYPGRSARCLRDDPFNPLLNVADNSVFMVDRSVQ